MALHHSDLDCDVRTFAAEENMLFTIPSFTEDVWKRDPTVVEAGVFKVTLGASCAGTGSSLQHIIDVGMRRGLEDAAAKQTLLLFRDAPNLYGHRSFSPNADSTEKEDGEGDGDVRNVDKDRADIARFLEAAKCPASYCAETCCSRALAEDVAKCENPMAVIAHYFKDVVPSICVRTPAPKRVVSRLVKQGIEDQKRTQKFISGLLRLPVPDRDRYIKECLAKDVRDDVLDCGCTGCCGDSALNFKKAGAAVYGQAIGITVEDGVRMTNHFGMYAVACSSILRMLPRKYPGITSPMLYFGSAHAFFPAHVEDLLLFSINYIHFGHPKIWFVVPPKHSGVVHGLLARSSVSTFNCSCSNLLSHKYFMLTPDWLVQNMIPFKVVVQNAGEAVVVGPNAIHFGFNIGHNVAESVNFANHDWIEYAMASSKCSCLGKSQAHLDIARIVAMTRPQQLSDFLNNETLPPQGVVGPGGIGVSTKAAGDMLSPHCSAGTSTAGMKEADTTKGRKRALSSGTDGSHHESRILATTTRPSSPANQVDSSDSDADVLYPSPPRASAGSFAQCPKASCKKEFKDPRKGKMLAHVDAKHEGDLLVKEQVELMFFSPNEDAKEEKVCCDICNKPIARGRFPSVMSRHQNGDGCKPIST